MQAETQTFLTQFAGLGSEQTGVWLKYRQYLNRQGGLEVYQEMPQLMTSWGLIFRALRAVFPNANYHQGIALSGFSQKDGGVTAQCLGGGLLKADLLVGADGSRSKSTQT
jgi:2-polyprenyl-6-methoxyphenol hydroxylase-like FAD-dependent oxidoreductase